MPCTRPVLFRWLLLLLFSTRFVRWDGLPLQTLQTALPVPLPPFFSTLAMFAVVVDCDSRVLGSHFPSVYRSLHVNLAAAVLLLFSCLVEEDVLAARHPSHLIG